jgi:hypothetical protein
VRESLAEIRTGAEKEPDRAALDDADSPLPPALREFLREIRRRRVGGVAVGYLFLAGVTASVVESLVGGLPGDPETIQSVVVAILAAGFPLALVIAWLYDITAQGLERTKDETPSRSKGAQLALKIGAIILSLALSVSLGWWILSN